MKKLLLFFTLLGVSTSLFSQWSSHTFEHDQETREYDIYIPNNLDPTEPVALLLYLHSMDGDKSEAENLDLNAFMVEENTIILSPEAIEFNTIFGSLGKVWNAGIEIYIELLNEHVEVSGDVDDIGFILGLIDEVKNDYNIDENKIWAAGFDAGGFMSQYIACEASDAFTAIASISGTRALSLDDCTPNSAIPVAHFHGTADTIVSTAGEFEMDPLGTLEIGISEDSLLTFWIDNNQNSNEPIITSYDDTNNDGIYLEHHFYEANGVENRVEHFIIHEGEHEWYDANNQEFDMGQLLWEFFNRDEVPEGDENDISVNDLNKKNFKIYPNPSKDKIHISTDDNIKTVNIYTLTGKKIKTYQNSKTISLEGLSNQMYFIEIIDEIGNAYRQKILKK